MSLMMPDKLCIESCGETGTVRLFDSRRKKTAFKLKLTFVIMQMNATKSQPQFVVIHAICLDMDSIFKKKICFFFCKIEFLIIHRTN